MDRLERLINLVAALKAAERPLTRAELFERVPGYPDQEASYRRAFERDKESLRAMGIPLAREVIEGTTEGYRIRAEDYELPDPGLDADELAALHLATSAVQLDGGEGAGAIWKLGGGEARTTGLPEIAMAGSEHLPLLFAAVGDHQAVSFEYRDETRTVDPWRIAFRNGRWYLSGRDHRRDEERQFRLDRMSGPRPVGPIGAFAQPPRPSASPPPPWEMGDEDAVEARIVVDADHVEWATGFLGGDCLVERRASGDAVFALRVTNTDAFRSMVLTFLDHAELLEPAALRADLVRWLEAMA